MALTDAPEQPPKPPGSVLRKLLPVTTVALVLAVLYVAWTFYSRYTSNKEAQQNLAAKQQEARQRVVNQVYGSGEIRFSSFSVDTAHLKRGESTQLCYGVVNATSLKLEPPVEEVKPSYHHCLEVSPKKTTTYTLTAADSAGHTKSLSLELKVE
jgi:hypothetical protein